MAKATNQSILDGIEGRMGDLVMRTVRDKTVVSKRSKGRSKISEIEKANHGLFQQASAFAVEAMRDPELKLHFQNIAKQRELPNGYTAALSLKLQELNTEKEELQKQSSSIAHETADAAVCVNKTNYFTEKCRDTENIIEDALLTISVGWRNIETKQLNEKQKEVLRTIVRGQISQWLHFV